MRIEPVAVTDAEKRRKTLSQAFSAAWILRAVDYFCSRGPALLHLKRRSSTPTTASSTGAQDAER